MQLPDEWSDVPSALQAIADQQAPVLNREQRRTYIRMFQNRVGRRSIVGFGRWRRFPGRAQLASMDARVRRMGES